VLSCRPAAELEATRSEAYFATALGERSMLVAGEGGVLVGYAVLEVQPRDRRSGLRLK